MIMLVGMKSLPEKQNNASASWFELYQQHGIALAEGEEDAITQRLTAVFDLLHQWQQDQADTP